MTGVTVVKGTTRILGIKDKKREGGGKISRRRNSCGQVNMYSNESTEDSTRVPCGVWTYKVPCVCQHCAFGEVGVLCLHRKPLPRWLRANFLCHMLYF